LKTYYIVVFTSVGSEAKYMTLVSSMNYPQVCFKYDVIK